ncbi:hypothetical protein [Methanospirillum hungatei]|nr:hypothetical protein [Methanospirillum hungatei]
MILWTLKDGKVLVTIWSIVCGFTLSRLTLRDPVSDKVHPHSTSSYMRYS